MKRFFTHILWAWDNLWTGSVSLIFRLILLNYIFVLALLLLVIGLTWFLFSGLFNFFRSWDKPKNF